MKITGSKLYRLNLFCVKIIVILTLFNSGALWAQGESLGIKTVVIDAGHGGKDNGCHGESTLEKDVALAVSLKLGKKIEQEFPGVKVIYTRKTDVFVELHERARIANKAKADLFICIHANAAGSTAIGTETFVMGTHKNEANLKISQRENSSILMEDNHEANYADFVNSPDAIIIKSIEQAAVIEQSIEFASHIQTQFREGVRRKDRGVKQAGFLVLYKTVMPSVLIETGFLTNKEEEEFLRKSENQDKMARAIFSAFKKYKRKVDKVNQAMNDEGEQEVKVEEKKPEEKEKKPETPVGQLVFKVQVLTSISKIELNSEQFRGLKEVEEYISRGLFKYTVGNYSIFEHVKKRQKELQEQFPGSFIVAFKDGERISLTKALELAKNK